MVRKAKKSNANDGAVAAGVNGAARCNNIINNNNNTNSNNHSTDSNRKNNNHAPQPPPNNHNQQQPAKIKLEPFVTEGLQKFLFFCYEQKLYMRGMPRQRSGDYYIDANKLYAAYRKFRSMDENLEFAKNLYRMYPTLANSIGHLLHNANLLGHGPHARNTFVIKYSSVHNYYDRLIENLDRLHRLDVTASSDGSQAINIDTMLAATLNNHLSLNETAAKAILLDPELKDAHEVDENAKIYELSYEGLKISAIKPDFCFSSTAGCFICQCNFDCPDEFEEHVHWHSEETDFESLKEFQKAEPLLKISYRICKNSHYFCFNISSEQPNIIIDKIVIMQANSMYYANNQLVPYKLRHTPEFFVDSHLFSRLLVQPVVIVFHYTDKPESRYVEQHHFMRTEEFPTINVCIKSNRLPNHILLESKYKLETFRPTSHIQSAISTGFADQILAERFPIFSHYLANNQQLNNDSMFDIQELLLQIEDVTIVRDYSSLVQNSATLRKFGNQYTLQLKTQPGILTENVLSVYDTVIAIPENPDKPPPARKEVTVTDLLDNDEDSYAYRRKKCHFGVVEKVLGNRVTFTSRSKLSDAGKYRLIFRPTRIPIRLQYRSMKILKQLPPQLRQRWLFPEVSPTDPLPLLSLNDQQLFNKSITNNAEQLNAVRNIVAGPSQKAPYIIFGPPGTGKTTTVVEAILQLYEKRPQTKILIASGSNGACDEVALRLCHVLNKKFNDNRAIVRIYSKSNTKRQDNIDEVLIEASNMYGAHFYPGISVVHEYRIIICTLSVIGRLMQGGLGIDGRGKCNVFTHLFLDEVAASTEPEALVGISSCISDKACLIISGDHKQLGPVLKSKRALELGLDISLMERLLQRECYRVDEQGNYDRSIQTRLCRNYRSHPEIVHLYSNLYYNGELRPLAALEDVSLAANWHRLPNPQFPIMFHSVFGTSYKDRNSSQYNLKEIDVVMRYIKDLMYVGIGGVKMQESDIGVISPYKSQYSRIQEQLNLRRWFSIETGAVETFQGREKKIIIVSFVRSFSQLGFLINPKRLNVTLSRAKSLLIMIGNPKTLSQDEGYKTVIDLCQKHGTMVGACVFDDDNDTASVSSSGSRQRERRRSSVKENRTPNQAAGQRQIKTKPEETFIASRTFEQNTKPTTSPTIVPAPITQTPPQPEKYSVAQLHNMRKTTKMQPMNTGTWPESILSGTPAQAPLPQGNKDLRITTNATLDDIFQLVNKSPAETKPKPATKINHIVNGDQLERELRQRAAALNAKTTITLKPVAQIQTPTLSTNTAVKPQQAAVIKNEPVTRPATPTPMLTTSAPKPAPPSVQVHKPSQNENGRATSAIVNSSTKAYRAPAPPLPYNIDLARANADRFSYRRTPPQQRTDEINMSLSRVVRELREKAQTASAAQYVRVLNDPTANNNRSWQAEKAEEPPKTKKRGCVIS